MSVLVFVLFFVFLTRNIVSSWREVSTFQWNISLGLAALVGLSALVVYPVNILCWHILLKSFGADILLSKNAHIWVVSNVARFLPGGVWQYPGRVYMASQAGIGKKVAVGATVLELVLNLGIGSLIVSVTIFHIYFLPLVCCFILLLAVTYRYLHLKLNYFLFAMLMFALKFLITGLVLVFLSGAALRITFAEAMKLEGVFALSWLVGYVVVFAPGGLGVTEASLAALMASLTPLSLGVTSTIALAYRFVLLIVELIVVGVTVFFVKEKSS